VLTKRSNINQIIFRIGLLILLILYLTGLIISTENADFFAQIAIATIFLFSLYCDIKFRIISNERFKDLFLFSFILNFMNIISMQNALIFIILKLISSIMTFILSLTLFSLTIIGGSDGKLIVLIFSIIPVNLFSFSFLMKFFLLLSICFIVVFAINFCTNVIGVNKYSFEILFEFYINVTVFKRIFIKAFYRFFNVADVKEVKNDKFHILAFYLIYNNNTNVFQILAHLRAPLVLVCIISYYITNILKIGI